MPIDIGTHGSVVTTSETALLAVGLALGAAVGVALALVIRFRSSGRGEVRITITPNAIPAGRPRTLAVPYVDVHPDSMPGWPEVTVASMTRGDARAEGSARAADGGVTTVQTRTRVPSPPVILSQSTVAVPVGRGPHNIDTADAAGIAALEPAAVASAAASSAARSRRMTRPQRDDTFTTLARTGTALETRDPPITPHAMSGPAAGPPGEPAGSPSPAQPIPATDPCGAQRLRVEERCAFAEAARSAANAAADTLREAQRAYDVLRERVDTAESTADPRRVAAEKERLHSLFRAATGRAGGPEDTEAAARAWLDEINALNAAVREARRIADQGNAELRAAHPALERLTAQADAARIASENAEGACRDARQDLAACEEADALARQAPPVPEEPHPFAKVWPVEHPDLPEAAAEPSPGDLLDGYPVVIRLLRGDREAHDRLVATLAAEEPDSQREWQLRISRLIDAIVGRAIEDGYLDPAEDHPFWRLFERREARDIVGALSALGYRYDGLGGFADGRVPPARDLSLAVGYAGLDRMRIRTWPNEAEIGALYERAVVAADQWLADQAGELALGQMVDALGGRAAELADLWNAWGRLRPALLAR
jgi:hypothetical protein